MRPVSTIISAVSQQYGIAISDIHSTRRDAATVWARHVAIWLARELTHYSLPQIGMLFGGRDHSSILHAVNRVEMLREADVNVRQETDEFHRLLGASLAPEPQVNEAVKLAMMLVGKPASQRAINGRELGLICNELLRLAGAAQQATDTKENAQ